MSVPSPDQLLDFSDKVVLVTGGGRGIGAGIALRFAEAGANVAVSYFSSEARAGQVVQAIRAHGRNALAMRADVRSREDVERLVEKTVEQPLDYLEYIDKMAEIYWILRSAGIHPRGMREEDIQSSLQHFNLWERHLKSMSVLEKTLNR